MKILLKLNLHKGPYNLITALICFLMFTLWLWKALWVQALLVFDYLLSIASRNSFVRRRRHRSDQNKRNGRLDFTKKAQPLNVGWNYLLNNFHPYGIFEFQKSVLRKNGLSSTSFKTISMIILIKSWSRPIGFPGFSSIGFENLITR